MTMMDISNLQSMPLPYSSTQSANRELEAYASSKITNPEFAQLP